MRNLINLFENNQIPSNAWLRWLLETQRLDSDVIVSKARLVDDTANTRKTIDL